MNHKNTLRQTTNTHPILPCLAPMCAYVQVYTFSPLSWLNYTPTLTFSFLSLSLSLSPEVASSILPDLSISTIPLILFSASPSSESMVKLTQLPIFISKAPLLDLFSLSYHLECQCLCACAVSFPPCEFLFFSFRPVNTPLTTVQVNGKHTSIHYTETHTHIDTLNAQASKNKENPHIRSFLFS